MEAGVLLEVCANETPPVAYCCSPISWQRAVSPAPQAALAGDWDIVEGRLAVDADDGRLGFALLDAVSCFWRDEVEAAAVLEYIRRLVGTPGGGREATTARQVDGGGTALHVSLRSPTCPDGRDLPVAP